MKTVNLVLVNAAPSRPLFGLRSISLQLDGNLPVQVIDQRGRGIPNVLVTAANTTTASPTSGFTDASGNVVIQVDATNPNPISVQKNKAFKTVNYTGGNSLSIQFEPPLP